MIEDPTMPAKIPAPKQTGIKLTAPPSNNSDTINSSEPIVLLGKTKSKRNNVNEKAPSLPKQQLSATQ